MKWDMHRREFLKASALAGAGLATGIHGSSLARTYQTRRKVIVIGGGIGGLSTGYEIMKRGHEVVVLEASGMPGGHVRTQFDGLADGLYADLGAEHFTRPGYDLFWEYVDELDLTPLPYPRAINRFHLRDGRFVSEDELRSEQQLRADGLDQREVDFLIRNPDATLRKLYFAPYLDAFEDEYDALGTGLAELDQISLTELLRRDGASDAAIGRIGSSGSALQQIWNVAILHLRGVPESPTDLWRLKGGNQQMTDALARKIGPGVQLGCEVTQIRQGDSGVTVTYREFGNVTSMDADFAVLCMPLSMLARIEVVPGWSEDKQHVIHNTGYTTESRVIMQSRTRFWEEQDVSPNLVFGDSALTHIWASAEEVDTPRGLILGDAVGVGDPAKALSTFRELYPGPRDTIEHVHVMAWPMDRWAASCNRAPFPIGQFSRFWPEIMLPEGRIYFAGASFDNLNWGMEAATRSARRVAAEIDAV